MICFGYPGRTFRTPDPAGTHWKAPVSLPNLPETTYGIPPLPAYRKLPHTSIHFQRDPTQSTDFHARVPSGNSTPAAAPFRE
ncbi:unnamed protein product [Adineta ricciae]|uniref:Uncharacterized protein n=1 Tax=Adineta ricciae TaxID=249248 RepID=A0A815YDY0_ADIRI|nr:unnamed protein product [Adineta ricciae]CAF1568998.1 unnamed protein product [Adineta ricciae]